MNKIQTYLLAFLILFLAFAACKQQVGLIVENPLPVDRSDEVIVVTRAWLEAKMTTPNDKLPVFKINDDVLPTQADDLDGDGKWDEVAFLVDLKASENKKISVSFVNPSNYPQFEKRTNLRLGILQPDNSYAEVDQYLAPSCKDSFKIIAQAESVSWENDKMGFRTYFDCRNVKDLFGKLKPELVIDNLGTPGGPGYHELADWGMDVLHCGSSLGAGGIALLKNDSLYRLGSTGKYEYLKIIEGPVRSVFELRYAGWEVDGQLLEAVERISVVPGKYWFKSDVTVKGLPEGATIVTGIVTSLLKTEPFRFDDSGYTCIGTHDVQSLNKDELGMAVFLPGSEVVKIARTTDVDFFKLGYQTVKEKNFSNVISQTYYVAQKCNDNQPARHYFAAVWGLEKEQWKTTDGFRDYLGGEMQKIAHPVQVR